MTKDSFLEGNWFPQGPLTINFHFTSTHWLPFDGNGELLRPLGLLFAMAFLGLRLLEIFLASRGGETRFFAGLGEDE